MEAAVERRSTKGARIPLDVLVELTHEDYEEPLEADGVNVGLGGLSMRAPYLPDVGARLVCRFEHPPTGERVEADAEVVWAHDTGTHTGEFGLRFVELAPEAQSAIRRMVGVGGSYVPPPPAAEDTIDEQPPQTVELKLDGVASPIVARVIHEADDGVTVEQELPFLRLRTGVATPDGRRGRIEAVDLTVDGDTPKLLLDVSYDDRSFVVPEADATIPDFIQTGDDTQPEASAPDPAPVAEPPPAPAGEPQQVFVTTPREKHERELAEFRVAEAEAAAVAPRADTTRNAAGRARASIAPVTARTAPTFQAAQTAAAALRAKLGPLWALVAARVKKVAKLAAERTGPAARTAGRAVRERLGRLFPRLAPAGARRRTTAPAPRPTNVTPQLRKQRRAVAIEDAREPRIRGRTVLGALTAVAAVGLAVYAFLPADAPAEEDRIALHREVGTPARPGAGEAEDDPEQGLTGAAEAPSVAAPSAPAARPAGNVQPIVPSALGDPSREAGPMPPPTFPSLREGARPGAPDTLPEGSPYAVDVREGGTTQTRTTTSPTTFGADSVSDARRFLIRMSRPVERIEGTPLTDGFRVRIPGSLSLDRAGPIASAHPLVERSMILNRGDHAELTIRFVEGRTPDYRVVARGSAIEVLIAER